MKKQNAHRYNLLHFQIDDDYTYTQTPHRNCRSCNKPYIKTMKSTISSSSSGQQPNYYNLASYARNITKSRFEPMKNTVDDLLQAVDLCKKPGEKFFREVQSAPEGMCAIASDTQLNDVSHFCAIPQRGVAEVLSIDLTFKLGKLYVLVTSFKNPMLINKLEKHPTHMGPVEIRHRKLLSSYRHFGSSLKRCDPKLGSLKAFGSDDEENIVKAFLAEFPEAFNNHYFRHFRRTIENRLGK